MLNKDQLLAIGLKQKTVKLEQGELIIREFNTSEREKFEMMAMDVQKGKSKNMKAKLIAVSVITASGGRYFGDDEIDKIAGLPSSITEKLFDEILAINGMSNDALEVAEGN